MFRKSIVILSSLILSILIACSGASPSIVFEAADDAGQLTYTRPDADAAPAQEASAADAEAGVACTPETDRAFCARFNKECGDLPQQDNCGAFRSAFCGACPAGSACAKGMCSVVTPDCVSSTDAVFCKQYDKNCGRLTKPDNCGKTKTVESCGVCSDGKVCSEDSGGKCKCPESTNWCNLKCVANSDDACGPGCVNCKPVGGPNLTCSINNECINN